jgi:hypothetical protein
MQSRHERPYAGARPSALPQSLPVGCVTLFRIRVSSVFNPWLKLLHFVRIRLIRGLKLSPPSVPSVYSVVNLFSVSSSASP